MRRLLPALLLLTAGCAAPAADLDPASLRALALVDLPDATRETLPNGDLLLRLAGEVAGAQEWSFTMPEGITYAEAIVDSPDGPLSVLLLDADTRGVRCYPHSWSSWSGRSSNTMRCTAIGAVDPGAEWILIVIGGSAGLPLVDGLPVPPAAPGRGRAVGFEVELTLSTQPLDGSAGLLKLDALSRPTFDALPMEVVDVPASADGAGLHVEITRPDTQDKVPVILRASPYNGPAQNAFGRSAPAFVDEWVPRGYAVAVLDLRGTGKSDGCFSMRAEVDQTDIADVVTWLGTQEWSTGKVGMSGISYEGFTPVAAAVQAPEHLAAIHAGAAAIDTWSNYLPGGVQTGRSFSTVLSYTAFNAMLTPLDEPPADALLHTVDGVCEPTIFPRGNDPRNLYDAWYAERNLTEKVANIRVPVYYEHGFWDNNVKANAITDFFNAIEAPKRGVFGSWQHLWALRADQGLRALAWFDEHLKGIDTGIMDTPVVEVLTNTRTWRAADAWPAPEPAYVEIPLDEGSFLAAPPALVNAAHATAGSRARTQTEPLADGLYLTGEALVDLTVAIASGGNVHLEARLYELPDEGEPLFAGVGWMNAAHRNGHDAFAPLAPGEPATLTLRLLPQDHVFAPGSRLAIEIRAVTDRWGGPESGVGATPGLVTIRDATLRLPTLPLETLSPQPRSAS